MVTSHSPFLNEREGKLKMEYHVSKSGNDGYPGTAARPFRTISRAAGIAVPGDTVTVHAGVYREWVSPANGGTKEKRIGYRSAGDGEVVISGAELVKDWKDEGHQVWSAEVDNSLFTIRNPFKEHLYGDWLFEGAFVPHLGEVYLNGKSLYECESLEKLRCPKVWPQAKYPADSLLQWYARAGEATTKIWANFGGKDPRREKVEINVRPYCFWPEKTGRNYITVRGFTLCQASPQWAPPTALQEGIIGPHWSKGWIIEENRVCESKCTGISLGKEMGTGQNEWSNQKYKGGTQREQEVIFRALKRGWNKEQIGSHIVRSNVIHDCEQAGIVGHLGGAFSQIYKNRIYNIHHKRIFHGAEVAGIKLHAALDTRISDNLIYGCYRAIWLDWQAQGTRICRNVFFDNLSEDLFVEVCHGPYTVDHNLFLSPMNFRNMSEGGAFVHNLFAGKFVLRSELTRYTPYHMPHETAVAGYVNIAGGDDRYYNNIFIGDGEDDGKTVPMTFFEHLPLPPKDRVGEDGTPVMDGVPDNALCELHPIGLGCYDAYPDAKEEAARAFSPEKEWKIPVSLKGNLYLHHALPSSREPEAKSHEERGIAVEVFPGEGRVRILVENPQLLQAADTEAVTGALLGKSYHAEMAFEQPDGTPFAFDRDFFGRLRKTEKVTPGPFVVEDQEPAEFVLGEQENGREQEEN